MVLDPSYPCVLGWILSGTLESCGARICFLKLIITSWVVSGDLTDMRSRANYISPEFYVDMHSRADHMSPEFCEVVTYMVLVIDGILLELTEY
ncbi:unnamed protein product [Prunus armeniaca]